MFEMVDGTGIIGVDMICPLGVSAPQPPNYDRVELEGAGMLVLPNSLDAPLERLELGGKTEQVQTSGKQLFDAKNAELNKWVGSTGIIATVGRNCIFRLNVKPNTVYQVNILSASSTFSFSQFSKENVFLERTVFSKGTKSFKCTTTEDVDYAYFLIGDTVDNINGIINDVMLYEGEEYKNYEPYTGGKPSPSPEYQQEIKSVGKWNEEKQKYEVSVKVTGKNLFDIEKAEVSGGNLCTAKRENNIVKITAIETVTSKRAYAIVSGGGIYLKSGKTYFLNGRKVGTSNMTPMFAFFKEKNNGELLKMGNFYTPNEDICIDIGIYLVGDAIRTGNTLEITDIIVCEGKDAAQYQPYTEQTITITSDRPITKWDKLVEQGGQIGWLYNSVNETIDGKTGKWSIQPASKIFYRTDITFPIAVPFCSELLGYDYSSVGYKKDTGITINNLGILCITLPEEVELTPDAYKQYLADNPLHVLYKGDSEEFVPLPEEEQNAIRALKAYYPTTVITADGGELDPDIKVTYRKEI